VHERPRIKGPQTAIVVGASGEEIDTDKYGRVKVQFHWDRKGKKDENSSCWLRVAQPLAGKGWGALALPRVGQEVLVAFLEGDPDRPLVVGTLYNETALPLDLPAKKNTTLLRTRSSKEGSDENFSELAFDDTKDAEKVYFHAEKDMERLVEHDDKLSVGKDGDGSRTVLIEKDSTLTINKGNRTETLTEGNDTLTIEKGDRTIAVKTGKETVTIKGDRSVTIESGKDKLEVTSGDQAIKLGGKGEIEATSGFKITVTGGKVEIDASPGIELKSGSNSIKLGPSGIEIKGMMVKIEGDIQSELKAAMVTVEASGILKAKGGLTMIG
ncbi:MAG TPA: type VI secretion system tip protein TssI/VgrG, partial [Planctomycetota bacterium]|nr:type VI secretion system tip protein TssI/VgrG [Planctomycetota bacterium]